MVALNCGKYFERGGADFQSDGGDGHFSAGLFGLGGEAGAQLFKFGDVGAVVLRDVRNRVPGFGQMFGCLAAHSAHGDAFNFAPLGKIWKLRGDKVAGARDLGGG